MWIFLSQILEQPSLEILNRELEPILEDIENIPINKNATIRNSYLKKINIVH